MSTPAGRQRTPAVRRLSFGLGGSALAALMLATVVAGGTIGYVLIEHWNAWDAFYMTVTTVSTVGYREVHPLSRAGQAFTVLLVLGGVGTALYAFSAIAAAVAGGGWQRRLEQRRHTQMIDALSSHFIVCGYGRIGSMIARQFQRQAVPFVVIERDPAQVRSAGEQGILTIEADASREEVLRQAGIDRARGLIAAVGTDAENVYAILTARVLRPDLFIVGRAESEDSVLKLQRAGADRVISPYRIGAVQMAQAALRPAVVDFVELAISSENLELAMEQVKIGESSVLAGQSLLDGNLRQKFGVVVVGIQRAAGRMEFNPAPDAVMGAGDTLVVLGRPGSLRALEEAAG
jgi:voltage-gated potassium channel